MACKHDEIEVGTLKAKYIELESDNGKFKISMSALESGVGIWVTEKDGPFVVIQAGFEGTCVGVNSDEHNNGHTLVLVAGTDKKEACIQLAEKDGKVVHQVTVTELAKLLCPKDKCEHD